MATPSIGLDFSNFAEIYERMVVGPLFRPWAEILVEKVKPGAGDRMLDIACGTGIVARIGRERVGDEGRVVGVDVNPQMLAVARRVEPRVEWLEGNAGALPTPADEQFDVVTCQQGLQFFPDKPLAVSEMRRVLARGGRLGASTWRPVEEMPILLKLQRIVEEHVGPVVDQRHSFGNGELLGSLLSGAGLKDVQVEVVGRQVRFDDWTAFVRMNAMALIGMSATSKEMSDEERGKAIESIISSSEEALKSSLQGQAVTYEILSNIATARG